MNPEIVDTMVRAAMQVMDNAYVPYGKGSYWRLRVGQ